MRRAIVHSLPASARNLRSPERGSTAVNVALLEAAIANSGDGFVVLDGAGRMLDTNETFVRQCGFPPTELAGRAFWRDEVDGTERALLELCADVAAHGPKVLEARRRKSDGQVWHAEYSISHHPADGGRWFVFCREITRRVMFAALNSAASRSKGTLAWRISR